MGRAKGEAQVPLSAGRSAYAYHETLESIIYAAALIDSYHEQLKKGLHRRVPIFNHRGTMDTEVCNQDRLQISALIVPLWWIHC